MDRRAIVLLLVALFIAFASTNLLNNTYVNDDFRIIYFVQRAVDDNLFQDDIMASYTESAQAPVTTLLLRGYSFFAQFFNFILLGKILGIVLFLLATLYAYKLGTAINKSSAFLFAFLLVLGLGVHWSVFSGGLSRAFGYPLFFAFLYYLLKGKNLVVAIVLILMALFYPPILLLSLVAYGLTAIQQRKFSLLVRNSIIPVVILLLSFVNKRNFGQMVSLREALFMPEFYSGGRVPVFRGTIPFTDSLRDTLYSIFNYHTLGISSPLYSNFIVILGVIALLFLLIYKKKLSMPKEIWNVAFASVICFVLAFVFFFYLYFPARYIVPASLVFIACAVSLGVDKVAHQRYRQRIVVIAIFIVLLLLSVPKIHLSETLCDEEELYSFLSDLPKDTLIAAHPSTADCIPLYSGRKVFVMAELSAGYHKKFYAEIKNRTLSFFDTYYSSRFADVQNFCAQFLVSHFVVDRKHFTSNYLEKKKMYYEPFNTYLKNITANRTDFALAGYAGKKEFEKGDLFVVKC